jgi:hypothetical protein
VDYSTKMGILAQVAATLLAQARGDSIAASPSTMDSAVKSAFALLDMVESEQQRRATQS